MEQEQKSTTGLAGVLASMSTDTGMISLSLLPSI